MKKKTASVSIIAANYNNGKYLNDFVNSITNSTFLPKELIIIDDGSTDNSLKILDEFSDLEYLKIIKFGGNRGFCEALNAGIEQATGKYIMRIDPDDIALKDRIQVQVNFLEKNKEIDVVGSNVIYFLNNTGKEVFKSNFPKDHSSIKQEYLNGDHGVQHPSTMIRSTVMKKYSYVQENVKAEDYEIFARMIKDGHRFANITEPLTRMRIHDQSAGSNIKYETIEMTFRIRDEIFGTSTKPLKTKFYYWYMLNYRKFLITQNKLMKPLYLLIAILCNPSKLTNRLLK